MYICLTKTGSYCKIVVNARYCMNANIADFNQKFLKDRAKNVSKAFFLLLVDFDKSLVKHSGTQFATGR